MSISSRGAGDYVGAAPKQEAPPRRGFFRVTPAYAGAQEKPYWIPAFAGMN